MSVAGEGVRGGAGRALPEPAVPLGRISQGTEKFRLRGSPYRFDLPPLPQLIELLSLQRGGL